MIKSFIPAFRSFGGRSVTGVPIGMQNYYHSNEKQHTRVWPKHGRDHCMKFIDRLESITGKTLASC